MHILLPQLIKLHRWLALAATPFLLLIILSGAVLAFKPIVDAAPHASVDLTTLVAAIDKADPAGRANALVVAADGRSFELRSRHAGPSGTFSVLSGERLGDTRFDIFTFARNLHVSLLFGAHWLVTLVTTVSVIVFFSGFLLGWRKLRNTLGGWHAGLGWVAWPLAMLTPITGFMMAFHIGLPMRSHHGENHAQSIARVIEATSAQTDLSHVYSVRKAWGSGTLVFVQANGKNVQYAVSGRGEITSSNGPGWVRMLHEGTWAGAWSGVLNFLSIIPLLGLLGTGALTWWRRQRLMSQAG